MKTKLKVVMASLALSLALIPTQEVKADANIGEANLYRMENVKENGTGDYLLELKLKDGWQPYSTVDVTLDGGLCESYHAGYTTGDRENFYVVEGVKGAVLEDIDNLGSHYRGKVTNPTNGIIEIPFNMCEEHEMQVLLERNASFQCAVNAPGAMYLYRYVYFDEAKDISERNATTDSTSKPENGVELKDSVRFEIGNSVYTLCKVDASTGKVVGNMSAKSMGSGEKPFMSNGRTLVPVRYAGEALGCNIEWNPAKREVIVKQNDITVRLPLNSKYAYYNDGSKADMGAKTVQVGGRTYVPVGALGRMLNSDVKFEAETQTTIITQK